MEGIRNGKEHYSVERTGCYVGHPTMVPPIEWCLWMTKRYKCYEKHCPRGKIDRNKINIINTRVADLLNKDGGTLYKTDIILTAGVGG